MLAEAPGGCTIGWTGSGTAGAAYRVTAGAVDSSGSLAGSPPFVSDGGTSAQVLVPQMVQGARFQVSISLKTLHVNGYAAPTTVLYTPRGAPGPPIGLSVISVRHESVDIRVSPPSTGGDFSSFMIVSTAVGGASVPIMQYASGQGPLVVQIGGLSPGNAYSILVSSCGRAGCTAASSPILATTAPRQPVDFKAVSVTATTVSLSWSSSSPTAGYTYRVRYRTVSLSVSSTFVTNDGQITVAGSPASVGLQYGSWTAYQTSNSGGAGTTATVSGLVKNSAYQFAAESILNGVSSEPIVYVARPVDQPAALDSSFLVVAPDSFNGIRRTSITVMWKPPAGSEVTLYRVSYWDTADATNVSVIEVNRFEKNELPDGIGNNYLQLTNLKSYRYYAVKVEAKNLNVGGYNLGVTMTPPTISGVALPGWVEPVPVDQPGRVQRLAVSGTTPTSMTIDWAAPPSPNSYFLSNLRVQVFYATAAYNATSRTINVTGNDVLVSTVSISAGTQATIPSLVLGTLYRITVKARNNNALGYEPGAAVYGGPVLPCSSPGCAVRNLRVAAYSGQSVGSFGSITLMWDAPVGTSPFDQYWYKVELVTGSNSPATLFVSAENDDLSTTTMRITLIGFEPIVVGSRYTFRVSARNTNRAGYGPGSEGTFTAYEQPGAMANAPSVLSLSVSSVSLMWDVPSPSEQYSYMVTWRLAGTTGPFIGQGVPGGGVLVQALAGQSTASGTVSGLASGVAYEFKVFIRNFHENGFEGQGSPTVTTSPKPPPPPPVNVRLSSATPTTVTVSWDPPPGSTILTTYKVLVGQSPSDPVNTTELIAQQIFSRTITGLIEGRVYYVTVFDQDLSGWSAPAQIAARPIAPAPGPTNASGQAIASGSILITFGPPEKLTSGSVQGGLSIKGYQIETRVPLGSATGTWTVLGTTPADKLFYLHENVGTFGVTLYYAVRAVIQQDASLGPLDLPGQQSLAQVYFGKRPEWLPGSPQDNATYYVPFESTLAVTFMVNASDPLSVSLSFRTVQALPPTAAWQPPIGGTTPSGVFLFRNLTIAWDPDLAGSTYVLCVTARDTNGLEAPLRCLSIAIPRPQPRLTSPSDGTRFVGRIGCVVHVHFVAEDRTSSNISPALALSLGYTAGVSSQAVSVSSRYTTVYGQSLPVGAVLHQSPNQLGGGNPATFLLEWRPSKGQEAFDYNICMVASGARQGEPSVCVVVSVARCQYCAQSGDTIQTMAQVFHTSWSQIWSGNHLLEDPDAVAVGDVISLGPTYVVQQGDDVDHIAGRFGASQDDVLLWNPDIGSDAARAVKYELWELQELCIIPGTCVYDASTGEDPRIDGLIQSYEPRP